MNYWNYQNYRNYRSEKAYLYFLALITEITKITEITASQNFWKNIFNFFLAVVHKLLKLPKSPRLLLRKSCFVFFYTWHVWLVVLFVISSTLIGISESTEITVILDVILLPTFFAPCLVTSATIALPNNCMVKSL